MRWRTVPASPRGPGGGNTARRGLQLAWEGTQSEAADPLRATGIRAGSVPVPGSGLPGNIRAGRFECEGIGPVRDGDASEYAAYADEDEAGGFGSLGFVVSGSRGQFRTFETEIPVVPPGGNGLVLVGHGSNRPSFRGSLSVGSGKRCRRSQRFPPRISCCPNPGCFPWMVRFQPRTPPFPLGRVFLFDPGSFPLSRSLGTHRPRQQPRG